MTYPVEIMLRGDERVFEEHVTTPVEAAQWTDADVRSVLQQMLDSIGRLLSPEGERRSVSLRGLSWIVTLRHDGVVLSLEIHSASAVAGPFAVDQARFEAALNRVVRGAQPAQTVH